MASPKKNALVRRAKGGAKTRRNVAIRGTKLSGNRATNLKESRIGLSESISSAKVRAHALVAFGDVEKTNHWLRRPNQLFQGRSPLQVLEVDPAAVEAELVRIEHGVYV